MQQLLCTQQRNECGEGLDNQQPSHSQPKPGDYFVYNGVSEGGRQFAERSRVGRGWWGTCAAWSAGAGNAMVIGTKLAVAADVAVDGQVCAIVLAGVAMNASWMTKGSVTSLLQSLFAAIAVGL